MTAAQQQPNPQRCETCKHYELKPEFDECMKCNHPGFKDDVFMHEIVGTEFDRIEKMGCASHSSARPHTSTPAPTEEQMECPTCHNLKTIKVFGRTKRIYDWETCKGCRFKKQCELPYLPPCGAYHDIDQMKEHDAAIARRAREQVLEVFAEVEYLHDVDGITYPDLYNEFIKRYKSLRSQQQAGEQG